MKEAKSLLIFFFFILFKAGAQDLLAVPASSFLGQSAQRNLITSASEQRVPLAVQQHGDQVKLGN